MTATSAVLFVGNTGQVSGAEKVLLNLVAEAYASGYRVTVACPDGPLADALPDYAAHLPIPPLSLGGERGPARLAAAARLLTRWWSAGRRLAPLVRDSQTATIVNATFALPALRFARPPNGAAWLVHDTVVSTKQHAVVRLSAKVIRVAVAVSEATAAPLREAGLPVRVAHNGVPWPVPQFGTELHAPPVIGMLALLTPWKGHRVLFEAAAGLPGVVVEIAGGSFPSDAQYAQELKTLAAQPELDGRIRFLGHVDPQWALQRWDAVVSASVEPEAGPLSVLEAMSHGLPVIGTDHGGTTEFLTDGAGLLVPPGDVEALRRAIERVLTDSALRAQIAANARRRIAERHDITVTSAQQLRALLPDDE